jgi:hypothetical protein
MPVHDWTHVDARIFHDFHQRWIVALTNILNGGVLPADFYALVEQHGVGGLARWPGDLAGVLVTEPITRVRAESDLEFYRRKQSVAAVRHASGDELVAVVEVVPKGNKSGRAAFDSFVNKVTEFLAHGIHMLIIDLQPPTSRDPQGLHGAIWDALVGEPYTAPADKPLTLAAYESAGSIRAYAEPIAVGDRLPPMPLFLSARRHVRVPIEETYQTAWESVPHRWRDVIVRS